MAIPSSGPISLQMFNTEFGLGNNLNAYRGKGNMPATGPISFSQLYGAVAFTPVTVTAVVQSMDFGVVAYDRRRTVSGGAYGAAGSINKQPFADKYLGFFGIDGYQKASFCFEGDLRNDPFLSGKRILIDNVEVAFAAPVYEGGSGYLAPATYWSSVATRPVFANNSSHTLTFTV